ncbi:response regulator [Alteromonas gilva]|uniref:Response regulator n=1 Tax=Alteromonas gilva TaxID=2987522 RepID=A0ABT5L558_9ALTE|nr:response regulator [Alteromonas gilva]MDC8830992.1 response regulator [Alteromonas gilva]
MPYQDVNILVVEDQRPFLVLLKGLLTNLGAKDVMMATSADQAIKFCRNHQVDIIVSDLHLGSNKKNGFELYQELQHRTLIGPGAVFLLISADAARPIVLGSLEHNPDDYLLKPFSQAQLKNRLNKAWQKKQFFIDVLSALTEKDYPQAESALQQLENMPGSYNRTSVALQTEMFWQQNKYQEAQALLTSQADLLPSQWAQLALGKTHLAMKQYPEAIKCANQVLNLNQFDPEALDILAQAKSAQNQPEEAIDYIKQAIKNSPLSLQRQHLACQIARENNNFELLIESTKATWNLSKNTIFKRVNYWCNHISSLLDAAEAADSKTQRHRFQQEALLQLQRAPYDDALQRVDEPFNLEIFDQLIHARVDAIDGKLIDAKRSLIETQEAIEKQFEEYPGSLATSSLQLMADLGEFEEISTLTALLKEQGIELDEASLRVIQHISSQCKESEQKYTQLNRKGIQLYQQEKYADAKPVFNAALVLSPVNAGITLNLLQCILKLLGKDKTDDAKLIREARQVYKILNHAPMRKQHQEKFDGLREELLRLGIATL